MSSNSARSPTFDTSEEGSGILKTSIMEENRITVDASLFPGAAIEESDRHHMDPSVNQQPLHEKTEKPHLHDDDFPEIQAYYSK